MRTGSTFYTSKRKKKFVYVAFPRKHVPGLHIKVPDCNVNRVRTYLVTSFIYGTMYNPYTRILIIHSFYINKINLIFKEFYYDIHFTR